MRRMALRGLVDPAPRVRADAAHAILALSLSGAGADDDGRGNAGDAAADAADDAVLDAIVARLADPSPAVVASALAALEGLCEADPEGAAARVGSIAGRVAAILEAGHGGDGRAAALAAPALSLLAAVAAAAGRGFAPLAPNVLPALSHLMASRGTSAGALSARARATECAGLVVGSLSRDEASRWLPTLAEGAIWALGPAMDSNPASTDAHPATGASRVARAGVELREHAFGFFGAAAPVAAPSLAAQLLAAAGPAALAALGADDGPARGVGRRDRGDDGDDGGGDGPSTSSGGSSEGRDGGGGLALQVRSGLVDEKAAALLCLGRLHRAVCPPRPTPQPTSAFDPAAAGFDPAAASAAAPPPRAPPPDEALLLRSFEAAEAASDHFHPDVRRQALCCLGDLVASSTGLGLPADPHPERAPGPPLGPRDGDGVVTAAAARLAGRALAASARAVAADDDRGVAEAALEGAARVLAAVPHSALPVAALARLVEGLAAVVDGRAACQVADAPDSSSDDDDGDGGGGGGGGFDPDDLGDDAELLAVAGDVCAALAASAGPAALAEGGALATDVLPGLLAAAGGGRPAGVRAAALGAAASAAQGAPVEACQATGGAATWCLEALAAATRELGRAAGPGRGDRGRRRAAAADDPDADDALRAAAWGAGVLGERLPPGAPASLEAVGGALRALEPLLAPAGAQGVSRDPGVRDNAAAAACRLGRAHAKALVATGGPGILGRLARGVAAALPLEDDWAEAETVGGFLGAWLAGALGGDGDGAEATAAAAALAGLAADPRCPPPTAARAAADLRAAAARGGAWTSAVGPYAPCG